MYSNINSRWAFEGEFTAGAITANATVTKDFVVPGVDKETCVVGYAMFVNESDLAPTSTAFPVIRAYIKEAGVVTVAVSALVNTITVASGAKVRFIVDRNDNDWSSDGL
jgi:hypothetical protein